MAIKEDDKKRTQRRTRVLMFGNIISAIGSRRVVVRDISVEGAQVYEDKALSVGQDVCFKRASIYIAARVAWCRKGVAGLKFYRRLTAAERDAAFRSVALDEPEA